MLIFCCKEVEGLLYVDKDPRPHLHHRPNLLPRPYPHLRPNLQALSSSQA